MATLREQLALAGLGLVLLSLVQVFRRIYFHPLSKYPRASNLAALTDFWIAKETWAKRLHISMRDAHDAKGEFLRIGPNHVSITASSSLAEIYLKGSSIIKSDFYDGFTAIRPNLFGTRDEDLHRIRRRQLARAFAQGTVLDMEPTVDIHMRKFRKWVDDTAGSGEVMDIKESVAAMVVDVLGDLAFSKPFGTLDARSTKHAPPIALHLHLAVIPAPMPWTLPYVRRFGRSLPIAWMKEGFRGRDDLRRRAEEQTRRMRQNPSKRVDILSSLINARDPETGEKLTEPDIAAEAFGFIVAGTHTTAISITIFLFYLLHADNAHVLAKLLAELDEHLSPLADLDTVYSYNEVQGLPYLNACLKESHRMAGIFNMPLPRVAPAGGMTIAGEYFPAGTVVSVSNYCLHYNVNIFGPDVNVFRPERYSDGGSKVSEFVVPFSVGHRACIGRNIAQTEILKTTATLLRNYVLTPLNPHEVLRTDSVSIGDKVGGYEVRIKRRN